MCWLDVIKKDLVDLKIVTKDRTYNNTAFIGQMSELTLNRAPSLIRRRETDDDEHQHSLHKQAKLPLTSTLYSWSPPFHTVTETLFIAT